MSRFHAKAEDGEGREWELCRLQRVCTWGEAVACAALSAILVLALTVGPLV
jgi:hypothetical protein